MLTHFMTQYLKILCVEPQLPHRTETFLTAGKLSGFFVKLNKVL